jgi:hypothetical protein
MRLGGRIWKDNKVWLAEVPMLDAMTQGRSRRDALRMAFRVAVFPGAHGAFEIGSEDFVFQESPGSRTRAA